jgi:nickel-dependent lactate racemase
MELAIKYGEQTERIKLSDKIILKTLSGNSHLIYEDLTPAINDLRGAVKDFLSDTQSCLIITNDYTRPTPTETVLSFLEPEIKKKDLFFLVALGSHRFPNEDEFIKIFGRFYPEWKERIICHNAKDNQTLKFIGKTSFGTPVYFNEALLRFKKIIVINSIEPHYFAGFTGGRKTFLPGIAGYQTITFNHKLSLSPKAKTLNLTDNPVSIDMEEVAEMVPRPVFSIQLVIDQKKELRHLTFGELKRSFYSGVEKAKEIFCLPIEKPFDCVLAVVREPYDCDLYQSQKALENAKLGAREGGIIILVSPCRKGVGDDEFIRVMKKGKTPAEVISEIEKNFVLGAHKSAKLAELVKNFEVLTVVPIEEEIINSLFMKRMATVQEAIDYCERKLGKTFSLLYLPDASLVTPLITNARC